jgi:hypothetical protein
MELRAELLGAARSVQDANDDERALVRKVGDEVGVDAPEAQLLVVAEVGSRMPAVRARGQELEGPLELVEHLVRPREATLMSDMFCDRQKVDLCTDRELVLGRV